VVRHYLWLSAITSIARVQRRDNCPSSQGKCIGLSGKSGNKEVLSPISRKFEWESPPSIMVTRNPN
jgi:hypothetical protein